MKKICCFLAVVFFAFCVPVSNATPRAYDDIIDIDAQMPELFIFAEHSHLWSAPLAEDQFITLREWMYLFGHGPLIVFSDFDSLPNWTGGNDTSRVRWLMFISQIPLKNFKFIEVGHEKAATPEQAASTAGTLTNNTFGSPLVFYERGVISTLALELLPFQPVFIPWVWESGDVSSFGVSFETENLGVLRFTVQNTEHRWPTAPPFFVAPLSE